MHCLDQELYKSGLRSTSNAAIPTTSGKFDAVYQTFQPAKAMRENCKEGESVTVFLNEGPDETLGAMALGMITNSNVSQDFFPGRGHREDPVRISQSRAVGRSLHKCVIDIVRLVNIELQHRLQATV